MLAALVAACGGSAIGPTGSGDLRGRTFLSTSVTESGVPRELAAGTRVSLRFTDDGRLLADAGCNTLAGAVGTRGGRLSVEDMSVTGIGCDRQRHDQDGWLAEFLQAEPAWRLDGDDLVLSTATSELVLADRATVEPDLALEGTRWMVDTVVEGDVASSVPAGATAWLVFRAGTIEVAAGCNTGSAAFRQERDTLAIGELTLTAKACQPDLMRLEHAVVTVLDGEISFDIEADVLRLKHPSGRQLHLRGAR